MAHGGLQPASRIGHRYRAQKAFCGLPQRDHRGGRLHQWNEVATIPIGQGVDANRFDPGTGLVFASCGDGTITVAHEDTSNKYTVVQRLSTQRGACTMALDTKNHNVYTVTTELGPPPPATPAYPRPRATVKPETFTLFIFSQ